MNLSESSYILGTENQWQTLAKQSFNHGIDEKRACRLAEQYPGIRKLKQKYPQINVEVKPKHIKPLKNGVYIGNLNAQGKPQGYGKIKYIDRSLVQAEFKDGKANGNGFKWFGEDWYYVGTFIENSFDGKGVFVSPELSYEGEFKNNAFHGQGVLKMVKNNGKFVGIMENGEMKEGQLTWSIVSKFNEIHNFSYKGTFKNNQFDGNGCTFQSSTGVYKGGFKDGKKEGLGRFEFLEKYQYIGEYKNNLKAGYGVLYNPEIKNIDGNEVCEFSEEERNISYKGNFENNLPHGKGYVYKEQQKKLMAADYIEGIWSEAIRNVVD